MDYSRDTAQLNYYLFTVEATRPISIQLWFYCDENLILVCRYESIKNEIEILLSTISVDASLCRMFKTAYTWGSSVQKLVLLSVKTTSIN